MEYLMSYGWALLVIVIVIAVLIYINPFRAPEQCVFDQAGFLCNKPILFASGALHGTLVNGNQKAITIMGIACIKGRASPDGDITVTGLTAWPSYTKANRTLGYQEQLDDIGNFANDLGANTTTKCVDVTKNANGVAQFPASATIALSPNDDFSGRLYVAYKFSSDPAGTVAKVVGANLVTKAQ